MTSSPPTTLARWQRSASSSSSNPPAASCWCWPARSRWSQPTRRWLDLYEALLATPFKIQLGAFALDKSLGVWINDLLMAIFFLLVGLEIKREVVMGELSDPAEVALPAIAALGGMVVPARDLRRASTGATRSASAAGRSPPRPTSRSRSACCRCSASASRWD